MNPFMMSNMFFGPMGMSVSPMCCSGINMPYYGQNDMCTFMNFPIFRNTAADFWLDPRLAMMQTQQSIMTGGSIFGNNFLPLFNNFPGMSPLAPWWTQNQKTETPEEKEKREAREAEAKKPDAKKAASLKKVFDSVIKLAEDKKNRFPKVPDELTERAKKAMEKETAKEQLEAMKEVMASIPADVLRKTVLADEEVKKQLKEAGYNFNLLGNKYSLKDEVSETDITHEKRMTAIRNDIESSMYQYTEYSNLASQLNSTTILPFLSAWNSKNNTKILDIIADNIPSGNDTVKLKAAQNNVVKIVSSMIEKADEYEGYPEITKLKKELSEKLNTITSSDGASDEQRQNVFTKENITELSKTFNKLYARLRMQEALKVRDYIKSNDDFRALNEVKEGIINDNMVIEETMKDLEGEGITNYPKVEELDKPPVTEEIIVSNEIEAENADDDYKDDPQALVDEYLVGKKGVLSKVGDSNVYQTKAYDENDNGAKYYKVKDGKLIEVKKTGDGKFEASANAEAVTAKEIVAYDAVINRITNLLENNAIAPVGDTKNLFKATGGDEHYALIDGKFGKVKDSADITKPEDLKAEDLEEFDDDKVKTAEKAEAERKDKEEKDVTTITTKYSFSTVDSIDNEVLEEFDSITGVSNDFEKTSVNGYFYCKSKKRYYAYNQKTGKLDYLRGVTKISNTGYMIKDGKWVPCTEIVDSNNYPAGSEEHKAAIQEYAKVFAKDLNGGTSDEEYIDAKKKLNTFTSFTDTEDIVNFIKGYKAYGGFWSNSGMCKQIATENGLKDGETHTDKESKRYYIKWIAIRMKEVVNKTNFSKSSEEYKLLEQISRGELLTTKVSRGLMIKHGEEVESLKYTAEVLDKIINKIIEAYDEKQN